MRQNKLNNKNSQDIASRLMSTTDESEINQIVSLFNLDMKKKDIIRASKLSDLYDKITDQMQERIEKHPGEFSNKELLDYMNSFQNIVSKQDMEKQITVPQIAVQNNTVNLNVADSLSMESKERIKDAISAILSQGNVIQLEELNEQENEE